jgi:hypothetical protein
MMTDVSNQAYMIQLEVCGAMNRISEAAGSIEASWTNPHILMKPTLLQDGNMWSALYGDDLAVGVAGFGETPHKAMRAFDTAWLSQKTNAASLTTTY